MDMDTIYQGANMNSWLVKLAENRKRHRKWKL